MIIRPARISDLETISKIEYEVFQHPWTIDQLAFEISNEPVSQTFVLEINDSLIGYVMTLNTENEIQIINIAISKDEQGNGYGKQLLHHIIQKVPRTASIFLEVRASNNIANQLYIAAGFQEIGRRSSYYPDNEDAIVMEWTDN